MQGAGLPTPGTTLLLLDPELLEARLLLGRVLELGADVLEVPTIRIEEPADKQPLGDALLGIGSYQWLVFTSPNGVERFFDYFLRGFEDLRDLGGCRIDRAR